MRIIPTPLVQPVREDPIVVEILDAVAAATDPGVVADLIPAGIRRLHEKQRLSWVDERNGWSAAFRRVRHVRQAGARESGVAGHLDG
jgi:hypothetical protein